MLEMFEYPSMDTMNLQMMGLPPGKLWREQKMQYWWKSIQIIRKVLVFWFCNEIIMATPCMSFGAYQKATITPRFL